MIGAPDKAESAAPHTSPLLVIQGMEVGFDGQAILPPIDIQVAPRSFWAVLGPNGSGKSTFVRTVLGLLRPVRGTVTRAPDLRPCYVPQQTTLDPIFPMRVLEFVLMGVLERGRLWGPARREDIELAQNALEQVKGSDLRRRLLRDLSGGQRQRVLFARALAARANLYVLDEPTAALDITSEREVLDLVSALSERRGAAVIMITHMVEDGLARADHVLLLDRDHGVAVSGSPRDIVNEPALQRLYGPVVARPYEKPP
ncbi:MAG: ATP-binding cassette domain-containing protein [Deltaproteobacteria bacterium]|nr:ATP-binding cassette domain-containing protein [Deltaproteobacteria bacterium]